MLAVDADRVSARHQELEPLCLPQERAESGSRLFDLLEVIHQQQEVAGAQMLDERPIRILDAQGGRDLGRDEVRVPDGGEADEDDPVREPICQLVGGLKRDPRLADASGAGDGDQAGLASKQTRNLVDLGSPSDERRRGGGQPPALPQLRRLDRQRRVLSEDRGLEAPQLRSRLEPELLHEGRARLAIGRQGVRLTARAVEREHELGPKTFTQGVLGDELLELGDEVGMARKGEVGFDALLECRQPKLVEPPDLVLCERFVGEVGQRWAAPHRERLAQLPGRNLELAFFERSSSLRAEALEPVHVQSTRLELEDVARRTGLELRRSARCRRECLPKP